MSRDKKFICAIDQVPALKKIEDESNKLIEELGPRLKAAHAALRAVEKEIDEGQNKYWEKVIEALRAEGLIPMEYDDKKDPGFKIESGVIFQFTSKEPEISSLLKELGKGLAEKLGVKAKVEVAECDDDCPVHGVKH